MTQKHFIVQRNVKLYEAKDHVSEARDSYQRYNSTELTRWVGYVVTGFFEKPKKTKGMRTIFRS